MIKRFVYIVLLLIFASHLSSANINAGHHGAVLHYVMQHALSTDSLTLKKHQQEEDKKKIKEILKAKRQTKPEKIDDEADNVPEVKAKPKRERRPEGLERPPEIPRRNGN